MEILTGQRFARALRTGLVAHAVSVDDSRALRALSHAFALPVEVLVPHLNSLQAAYSLGGFEAVEKLAEEIRLSL